LNNYVIIKQCTIKNRLTTHLTVSVGRTALPDSYLGEIIETRGLCRVERAVVLFRALVTEQVYTLRYGGGSVDGQCGRETWGHTVA